MPVPTLELEIADTLRRLSERDPSLDLHRIVPALIATLQAKDAAIRTQTEKAAFAEREMREANERAEAVQIEITRERAVIAAARRLLDAIMEATDAMANVLADFDAELTVIRG